MISNEQIERTQSEFTVAAREAITVAAQAERALEAYTYPASAYESRRYDPEKRGRLLAEFREADYLAESRSWISNLIREARVDRGIPDSAVCFFKDGNKWCCVHGDFVNLQESPAGFGETFEEALADLKTLGHGNGCPCGKCEWTDKSA